MNLSGGVLVLTKAKGFMRGLWRGEEGLGTLEVILIIAVVIIIALLFKDWIIELVQNLMGKADEQANDIFS